MKNKEFKKGVAIGVAATLVVTGAGFVSYQKVLFPKGNALSDVKTVQKLNYLEELINTEYLDEKDESGRGRAFCRSAHRTEGSILHVLHGRTV